MVITKEELAIIIKVFRDMHNIFGLEFEEEKLYDKLKGDLK